MSSVIGHLLSVVSTARAVNVDVGFGGPAGGTGGNIADYISRIYMFGVGIAGILAVGVIVFGAIYYAVSGGNPDKQRDARSYITSAIWGLVLLLGSYLILNTINPQITNLSKLQQTKTCGQNENPKEAGCIPAAPRPCGPGEDPAKNNCFLPACKAGQTPERDNCLPACTEGQRPCLTGEEPEPGGCTACAYSRSCPQTKFTNTATGQVVPCTVGSYKEVLLSGPYIVPGCGTMPPFDARGEPTYAPGTPKDCSHGLDDRRFYNVDGVNFSDGVARVAPLYPSALGPSSAQCLIYAYIESLEPGEYVRDEEGRFTVRSNRWKTAKTNGLIQCSE